MMINSAQLDAILAGGETVRVEFKSDRQRLPDRVIYEEVVALANTEGGVLLVGVEDDGSVRGAQARHGDRTEPLKVQAAIANNTVPSSNTRVSLVEHAGATVLAIEVEPSPEPCATSGGKALMRTLGADGKPQSVPFYPHDQRSRRVELGFLDFSAKVLDDLDFDSLDPLEFERLRQTVARLHGDSSLEGLSEPEIAKALRLVETDGDRLVPNVAGLLLLGREALLEQRLPTHEVHFQVLDATGDVKMNDSFRGPLMRVLEEIELRFAAHNSEREVVVGLFRLPIPLYAPYGFREALNNAVLHRDYTQLGAVYVQWHADHLLITNPGGFPRGVHINNLLVHEPKPRNPRLAAGFKRIGLIEQTGRGVDKVFLGQLRYGRPAPDYSRSDSEGVRVVLRSDPTCPQFATFVYRCERDGRPLGLDELLVLNALSAHRRIDADAAGQLIQKGSRDAQAVLKRLQERNFVAARDEAFVLSAEDQQRLTRFSAEPETPNLSWEEPKFESDARDARRLRLSFVDAWLWSMRRAVFDHPVASALLASAMVAALLVAGCFLLGQRTHHAREALVQINGLSYPAPQLLGTGVRVVASLPWKALLALVVDAREITVSAAVLLLMTCGWLVLGHRRPSAGWLLLSALGISVVALTIGSAFYTFAVQGSQTLARPPELTGNVTDRIAFASASWLINDSPRNEERREALNGLLLWLLLATGAGFWAGTRATGLGPWTSGLRWALIGAHLLLLLFLLGKLPDVHAMAEWGLKYPRIVATDCDPELGASLSSGECLIYDVSAGAREMKIRGVGNCSLHRDTVVDGCVLHLGPKEVISAVQPSVGGFEEGR